MKTVTTKINIKASANQIWKVLMAFEKYGEWNPLVKEISGVAEVGAQLKTTIHLPENKPMKFQPIVLEVEKDKAFRWKGKLLMPGIFDGEHYFILEKISEQETIFHHGENFTGILSGLLFKMIGKETLAGFELMNQALKERVEGMS